MVNLLRWPSWLVRDALAPKPEPARDAPPAIRNDFLRYRQTTGHVWDNQYPLRCVQCWQICGSACTDIECTGSPAPFVVDLQCCEGEANDG